MICIDRITMKDGTIYRNLYYPSIWFDIVDAVDSGTVSLLFNFRNEDGSFDDLELMCSDISNIELGEKRSAANDLFLYYSEELDRHVVSHEDDACDFYEDGEYPCDRHLYEAYEFFEDFYGDVLDKYENIPKEDKDVILDNILAISIGYLDATNDFEDPEITAEGIILQAYIVAAMMVAFADKYLEDDYKFLMRDHLSIIPAFSKFFEENEGKLKIVETPIDEK